MVNDVSELYLIYTHLFILITACIVHLIFVSEWLRDSTPASLHILQHLKGFFRVAERKLNRPQRSQQERFFRGAVLTVASLVLSGFIGTLLSGAFSSFKDGWVGEALFLALLLGVRPAHDDAAYIMATSAEVSLNRIRQRIILLSSADPLSMDIHGMMRASLERIAEIFSSQWLTVSLWYVILGLPGAMVALISGMMTHSFGYESDRFQPFGRLALTISWLLSLPANYLCALIFMIASFIAPGTSPKRAVNAFLSGLAHPSTLPCRVLAGVTETSLLGPITVDGSPVSRPWLDYGSAKAIDSDLRTGVRLYRVAIALSFAALAFGYISLDVTPNMLQ